MATSMKMYKKKKSSKKINMKMSTHQTENYPSNNIIKNQDQNDQEDATIENEVPEKMIEDEDM